MYYNSSDKGYLRTATTRDSSGRSGCCTVTVNVPVESVKVNDERRIMYTGTTDRFEVTVCPHNATNKLVRWSSTNTNVATVDPATGRVTAIGVGTARIIATAQDGTGKSGACELTVKPAIPVEGVTICNNTYTMKVGETTRLSYSVYPTDATNQRVTWCSSDPNVAEVGSRNRKITAKRAGKTTITVTTDDGNFVASCEVTVEEIVKHFSTEKTIFGAVVNEVIGAQAYKVSLNMSYHIVGIENEKALIGEISAFTKYDKGNMAVDLKYPDVDINDLKVGCDNYDMQADKRDILLSPLWEWVSNQYYKRKSMFVDADIIFLVDVYGQSYTGEMLNNIKQMVESLTGNGNMIKFIFN